jgi:hypothetical protein
MAWRIVFGQLIITIGIFSTVLLFEKFIGGATGFILFLFGLPAIGISLLVVLGYALWRPNSAKTKKAGVALLLMVIFVPSIPQIAKIGDYLFFNSRKAALNEFVKDILTYEKIINMSNGLRHFKELNGELVGYTDGEIDKEEMQGMRRRKPVAEVLSRDDIDPAKYEEFRNRLRQLEFIEFEVQPGYVAFLYDGFLDNLSGYLYTRDGAAPPPMRTLLFLSHLIGLRSLGNGWYSFSTT